MADNTHIEWTDATWNPITGCSVVSPGCTNCYAMRLAGTRLQHHKSRKGLTIDSKAGPVWNGDVRFNEEWLTHPLSWKRPRRIFVCAHGDLFHESVPDAWIDKVFAVMALAPRHTFQVLTKRAGRMRAYLTDDAARSCVGEATNAIAKMFPQGTFRRPTKGDILRTDAWAVSRNLREGYPNPPWPLPNVWLGVSVEDQARADERIPILLDTPAAVRWISAEPLLGPVDLRHVQTERHLPEDHEIDWKLNALSGGFEFLDDLGVWCDGDGPQLATLDWVVAGGESGPGARPMHPDWARQIRDDCADAGVPFLFKQWGEYTPGENVTRRSGVVEVAWRWDDKWVLDDEDLADVERLVDDEPNLYRIGKRAAGRALDGVTHDAYPGARA